MPVKAAGIRCCNGSEIEMPAQLAAPEKNGPV